MNNIISNFAQIINFAKDYQLPLTKQRAILREYLQCKILDLIYKEKISQNIYFVGGTALRLLHNLDRFSEDLDFDTDDIYITEIDKLIKKIHESLLAENIDVEKYQNKTKKRIYYELRFKNLLFELNISHNVSEKLMIKIDIEHDWKSLSQQTILFNRYGFLFNTVSLPLNQILVQKLYAYISRKQTLPRDIYDIIWLVTHRAKIDKSFLQANKLPSDLVLLVIRKYENEKSRLSNYLRQLKPFLINEEYIEKLNFFTELLKPNLSN